jgi:acyl-coenzyme A synthetase/AMP-(fatty) acid ligase/acyl carrier protein
VSVWELFWWSFVGASVALLKPEGEKSPEEIISAIAAHKVTTIHFVPSMLSVFLAALRDDSHYKDLASLQYVFASGEALRPEQVNLFGAAFYKKSGTRLINLYGPTEATVDVSYFECDLERRHTKVPIGRPIDNTQLYIMDKDLHLAPVGVPGELYIAGAGLARGYLNNKLLSDEKFIGNPYCIGERMYKTGDLAEYMADGNILFLGRKDNQVKIRGFRIELGEIESQLSGHYGVKECVVILKGNDDNKYLIVYYTGEELKTAELRAYLSDRLPAYMVPPYYVRMQSLPLTTNGKLDRKALPDPEISKPADYLAPASDTAKQLVEIWSDVLSIDSSAISIHANFFELGGHSIGLIKMNSRINERFKRNIPLVNMFRMPTITSIEDFILNGDQSVGKMETAVETALLEANDVINLLEDKINW